MPIALDLRETLATVLRIVAEAIARLHPEAAIQVEAAAHALLIAVVEEALVHPVVEAVVVEEVEDKSFRESIQINRF